MEIAERLTTLIEHGAAIQVFTPDDRLHTLTLAGAVWLDNPTRLRWCAIFPEHQGHIHETAYDDIETHHERDVAFYRDGEMVAYVCPYEEGPLPLDAVREALGKWRAILAQYNNAELFEDFLDNA
jgi:hypothetical protein